MPATRLPTLNLLPQDPFLSTPVGRFLTWSTSVGRYLIIFTLFLVVGTIAAKFKLDRDLTDLNAVINQQSNIIDSYGDLENQVRNTQGRLSYLKKTQATPGIDQVLDLVAQSLPQEVTLATLQIGDNRIGFNAHASSTVALASLVVFLRQNPKIKNVTVQDLRQSDKGLAGYDFSIQLELP